MISIQHDGNLVSVTVMGEFSLADFKAFEEEVLYAVRFQGKADLLLDLRGMLSYTVDVVWEELRFTRAHAQDFARIAVVTGDEWMVWSAWLSRLFTGIEIRVFDVDELALDWLAQPVE